MWANWGSTSRCRDGEQPLPGDIVTVFTSDEQTPVQGNHIVLVVSSPDEHGDFHTLEGNAHGEGPEGRIEGVIKRQLVNMEQQWLTFIGLLSEDFED